ncbi:MAG: hypothetical protein GX206_03910 [Clostridiales bacterium]|nr:hypothetical protein [Clostridiales bacterium]
MDIIQAARDATAKTYLIINFDRKKKVQDNKTMNSTELIIDIELLLL